MPACSNLPNRPSREILDRLLDDVAWESANPDELAGLLIGSHMRVLRDRGVSRDLYMQACALLWDNNNPTDVPVDEEV